MAASEAAICNIALGRIGIRQFIDELDASDDASEEAQACSVYYEAARDAVLTEARWQFAKRRATLGVTTEEREGWEFVYSLPDDCLDARELDNGLPNGAASTYVPFALEMNDDGDTEVLVTNEEDAILVYTARVTAPGLFPPLFTQALAWKLASELALALPVKPGVGLEMEKGYQRALQAAIAADFRQGQEGLQPDSPFISGR